MEFEIKQLLLSVPMLPREQHVITLIGSRADPSLLKGLGDYLVLFAGARQWNFGDSLACLDTIIIQSVDEQARLTQHSDREGILLGEQYVPIQAIAPVVPYGRYGQVGEIYRGTEDYGRVVGRPVYVRQAWRELAFGRA